MFFFKIFLHDAKATTIPRWYADLWGLVGQTHWHSFRTQVLARMKSPKCTSIFHDFFHVSKPVDSGSRTSRCLATSDQAIASPPGQSRWFFCWTFHLQNKNKQIRVQVGFMNFAVFFWILSEYVGIYGPILSLVVFFNCFRVSSFNSVTQSGPGFGNPPQRENPDQTPWEEHLLPNFHLGRSWWSQKMPGCLAGQIIMDDAEWWYMIVQCVTHNDTIQYTVHCVSNKYIFASCIMVNPARSPSDHMSGNKDSPTINFQSLAKLPKTPWATSRTMFINLPWKSFKLFSASMQATCPPKTPKPTNHHQRGCFCWGVF